MEKLVIKGGRRLNGTVYIGGAKNAALPIMAATLLAEGEYCIGNVPKLKDICTMSQLLGKLGVKVKCAENSKFCSEPFIEIANNRCGGDILFFENSGDFSYEAPYELVKTMRASILALGPLLVKRKRAKVSLPGGCAIGERPVDLHIAALEKMGAKIDVQHGYIDAFCDELKGAEINFKTITVTGTENIMMAAVLANGTTVLNNAAAEPEVVDLAVFLRKMGADISGEGTNCITINGVDRLHPADHNIMPDRIEAGTLLCAVAGAGGRCEIKNAPVHEMVSVIDALRHTGVSISVDEENGSFIIESSGELNAVDITTMPYPGFPTDMQAQFMAVMTKANGASIIDETIFENRFMHVPELKRMGADISMYNGNAVVKGVKSMSGAPVMASDLRASAGLVIAALMCDNTSEIHRIYHLDRGYESFEIKLSKLGADIKRVHSDENGQ